MVHVSESQSPCRVCGIYIGLISQDPDSMISRHLWRDKIHRRSSSRDIVLDKTEGFFVMDQTIQVQAMLDFFFFFFLATTSVNLAISTP